MLDDADPADYVAAAIAYALYDRRMVTTADVSHDFQNLLAEEYSIVIPKRAVLAALRVLGKQGMIELSDDRYLPLVTIPRDYNKRLAKWRFIDERTPANSILHRFMDGPHDWMRRILQSSVFGQDVIEAHGSVLDDYAPVQREQGPVSSSLAGVLDKRSIETLKTESEIKSEGATQIHIHNNLSSGQIVHSASPTTDSSGSAVKAGWLSAWGSWVGAIATIAALVLAYLSAKTS